MHSLRIMFAKCLNYMEVSIPRKYVDGKNCLKYVID